MTETKVEGVRSGRSWSWMWSVMEAPGGSKAFPGRPGFSAKKRPQGDGGGNPQAQIWGGASRGSQARGCWPVDLGGTDDASDRGGWHCRKMKSFGLGGGSGLKEPLALPPTVPCFSFSLPSAGVGSLWMLQGPPPGATAQGPAVGLNARLWCLVGSARAEALVPAGGNHCEATLWLAFPANRLLVGAPFLLQALCQAERIILL